MERKTKKFYYNTIMKSFNDARKVFIEALEKYTTKSEKCPNSYVDAKISNNWNGWIEGFSVSRGHYDSDKHGYVKDRKHDYYIEVYMQGDHTDSSQSLQLNEVLSKGSFQISFEERYINGSSQKHIAKFNQEQLYSAMKIFADGYLK